MPAAEVNERLKQCALRGADGLTFRWVGANQKLFGAGQGERCSRDSREIAEKLPARGRAPLHSGRAPARRKSVASPATLFAGAQPLLAIAGARARRQPRRPLPLALRRGAGEPRARRRGRQLLRASLRGEAVRPRRLGAGLGEAGLRRRHRRPLGRAEWSEDGRRRGRGEHLSPRRACVV